MTKKYEPFEHEMYETNGDKKFLIVVLGAVGLIITIIIFQWNPNVEVMGTAVYERGDMNSDGVLDLTDLSILAATINDK